MPEFKYVGDEGRTYFPPNAPAVTPSRGETHKFARDPGDGRWQPVTPAKKQQPKKTPVNKPAKKPAPAGETKE